MKLASLYSGGKDSTLSMYLCELAGYEVPYLLTVRPEDQDSMMFHVPNIPMVREIARSMGKKLIESNAEMGAEMAALEKLLIAAREKGVKGVVTGAVLSDYQFFRINRLCFELGLDCIAPLWRKDQLLILELVLSAGIRAVIVSISAEGLENMIGREIDQEVINELKKASERYGINACGEGGEYETFVLDSPLHRESLEIVRCSTVERGRMKTIKIEKLGSRKKSFSWKSLP